MSKRPAAPFDRVLAEAKRRGSAVLAEAKRRGSAVLAVYSDDGRFVRWDLVPWP